MHCCHFGNIIINFDKGVIIFDNVVIIFGNNVIILVTLLNYLFAAGLLEW